MSACLKIAERYNRVLNNEPDDAVMPKVNPLIREEIIRAISYDPETGILRWLIAPAKNVKVGDVAGCPKGARFSKKVGRFVRYVYVRLNNIDTPAARIAWLLHHGDWPEGNVLFADGDTENLRIANLQRGVTMRSTTGTDGVKSRKMTAEAQRGYGLNRYYGMTLEQYNERLGGQNGVCAICEKPETAVLHGKVKPLSVDHSHTDGAVRDLLCSSCNHLLGHAREDRNVLLAAIKYLDKHAASPNVVSLDAERVAT